MKVNFNKKELEKLPTLCQGQADDLKIDNGKIRVWISRVDNSISVEQLIEGSWILIGEGDK